MSASGALFAIALVLYGLSIILLVIDVVRAPDLSGAARVGWSVALVVTSFFGVVLWFAQGRTGRIGRVGSVVLVLAIAISIVVIVIEALRVL